MEVGWGRADLPGDRWHGAGCGGVDACVARCYDCDQVVCNDCSKVWHFIRKQINIIKLQLSSA